MSIPLELSVPSAFSTTLQEEPATLHDAEMHPVGEHPPPEVTSNMRQSSSSDSPYRHTQNASYPLCRSAIAEDKAFGLPPPDLAPRFVFKSDMPSVEERTSISPSDDTLDSIPRSQALTYARSSPSPRIYFARSAITFVPPFSYDFLERDPNAKGVPRNYRAWIRAGRPKLDVEGLERAEAKRDFLAMGLIFPQDSDSEYGGTGGDHENRKRKRRKKAARAQMVPTERPRRTARKIVEAEPPAPKPLPIRRVVEKRLKAVESKPVLLQPPEEAKKGAVSKSMDISDGSERRSSSTLLDTDVMSKRERLDSDQGRGEAPCRKKQRISVRLYARKYGMSEDPNISEPASGEELARTQSPLSDLTPSPQPSKVFSPHVRTTSPQHHRSISPGPSHSALPRAQGVLLHSLQTAPGSSQHIQFPASCPGHRVNRDQSSTQPQPVPIRTFPSGLPILTGYPGFYQRYPIITQFDKDDPVGKCITQGDSEPKRSLGNWNAPRDHRDLYTPRYTKGTGSKKIALCPLCYEDPARGGEGRQEWNHTKTSQHNYHMQYYHGISATRCAPFSPPIAHRTVPVPRPQTNEKLEILQGKCHRCKQWIALEGCKMGDLKVKELFWWKHAAGCHKDCTLNGEADTFIEDDVFCRLKEYEAANSRQD